MRIGPVRASWASALGACLLASCSGSAPTSSFSGWTLRPAKHARYFQEWSRGDERLLITFGAGGVADTTGIYQLSPNGVFSAAPARTVRLKVPLTRVALHSTTHASYLSALGGSATVVACAHAGMLRDPALVALRDKGLITEIATGDGLDREQLAALRPAVLFSYPYGKTANDRAVPGVATVDVSEYLEPDPLGRAEWLKLFGTFLRKERVADSLFDAIAARYDSARSMVPPDAQRPSVFFGSSWKGTWSVPSGDSYMAKLIADAGAHYLFADRRSDGNIDIDLETALATGAKADFWGRILFLDHTATAADVAGDDARIMALPAFTEHHCFSANSAESDLFGEAGLQPDVVLLDLLGIFHPELAKGRAPVYFKPVQ